ncbi:hypothetical protein TIFTF001_016099 [Ficus carica]|uniref:Uncharacterized protein n=1 Tax=Ficus carica TaxID=3494 RepID=A0AA88D5U5_FICCA|nr:hypothetical protein TIFTF001_016099 [Ficus carica]
MWNGRGSNVRATRDRDGRRSRQQAKITAKREDRGNRQRSRRWDCKRREREREASWAAVRWRSRLLVGDWDPRAEIATPGRRIDLNARETSTWQRSPR